MTAQNTAKPAPLPLLSDNQESLIKDSFRTLLSAVGSYGSTELPATFADLSVDQWELLASRALKGIRVLNKARKEEALREVRQGIASAITPHIESHRAEKAQYDAAAALMPENMRKFLAPFPTAVNVPMSDVAPAFPQGTRPEVMVVALKDLSYTIGKGADGKHFVKVPTPFTSK